MTAMVRSIVLWYSAFTLALASYAVQTAQDIQVVASFKDTSSVVVEGDSTARVAVKFSAPFNGSLRYQIRQLPNGQRNIQVVDVSGTTAVIPITAAVSDDGEVEDARTFEVALLESTGYELGSLVFHTLVVEDNDALWNGSYQSEGLSLQFQLKIVRNGDAVSGALVTDGFSIIPLNGKSTKSTEWPLNNITLNAEKFSAEVSGIQVPAKSSQIGVAMERRFWFEANKGRGNDIVDLKGTISGQVTEWVTARTDPYLNRTLKGRFTLQKRIPTVVALKPSSQ